MLAYSVFILTLGGIYALLALSLNLVWGMTGLVNLGLAGFYGAAICGDAGVPFVPGLAAAVAASIVAGLAVTLGTLRLRDDYLAIVTLGFAEVVRLVALNERWLTKGAVGISGIRNPFRQWFGIPVSALLYLALVSVMVLAVWAVIKRIDRSAYGRVLRAIRDDQELATFAGKRVLRFKLQAFGLGAAVAGLAGALYAHQQSYISPDYFDSLVTIYIFLAVAGGGAGRPVSAAIGGYVIVAFLEAMRFLSVVLPWLEPAQIAALRTAAMGAALFLILRLRPQGLLPERIPTARKSA